MTEGLRDEQQAAAWLGVPVAWLEGEVRARRVSFTQLGPHVRFTQAQLDELVTRRTSGAAPDRALDMQLSDLRPVGRRGARPTQTGPEIRDVAPDQKRS